MSAAISRSERRLAAVKPCGSRFGKVAQEGGRYVATCRIPDLKAGVLATYQITKRGHFDAPREAKFCQNDAHVAERGVADADADV